MNENQNNTCSTRNDDVVRLAGIIIQLRKSADELIEKQKKIQDVFDQSYENSTQLNMELLQYDKHLTKFQTSQVYSNLTNNAGMKSLNLLIATLIPQFNITNALLIEIHNTLKEA